MSAKLKYIFIGNLMSKKDLGDFPIKSSDQVYLNFHRMPQKENRSFSSFVSQITTNLRRDKR